MEPGDQIRVVDGATKRPTDITGCIIPFLDGEPVTVELHGVRFVPLFSQGPQLLKQVDNGPLVLMGLHTAGVRVMLNPRLEFAADGQPVTRWTEVLPAPSGEA